MMGGAGSASAEPRRRITVRRPARPVERRKNRAEAMTPPAKNRQRDVSESLAQLCSCVPLSP